MDDLTKDEKKRCYIQKRLISDTREEPDTGESSRGRSSQSHRRETKAGNLKKIKQERIEH